jgi:DNA-directed RNA polymerase specialized sigma24 family protein
MRKSARRCSWPRSDPWHRSTQKADGILNLAVHHRPQPLPQRTRRPVVGAELPDVVDLRAPERAASEAEQFRQLDAALGALPFEQRSAFGDGDVGHARQESVVR